jgi:hypothetical protein
VPRGVRIDPVVGPPVRSPNQGPAPPNTRPGSMGNVLFASGKRREAIKAVRSASQVTFETQLSALGCRTVPGTQRIRKTKKLLWQVRTSTIVTPFSV